MDRTERFYMIDQLLQQRQSTSIKFLMSELEVSKSTVKRDLMYLRDRLHAPIVWDRHNRGYRYKEPEPGFPRFSLPGLWFNSSELHALLTMEHLLKHLQPGFLASHIDPLRNRVRKLLEGGDHSVVELVRRIRIVPGTSPHVESAIFQKVANAVLSRLQIYACYLNRGTNQSIFRYISPQRLVYYNENWYLDGWCHLREGLRTFRLSNLTEIDATDLIAIDIDDEILDAELKAGFGIFVGGGTSQAVLRFDAYISRWVKHEMWHSNQTAELDESGRLILTIPYSNDPELVLRILQYGSDVEVLEPVDLRDKIATKLLHACAIYQN